MNQRCEPTIRENCTMIMKTECNEVCREECEDKDKKVCMTIPHQVLLDEALIFFNPNFSIKDYSTMRANCRENQQIVIFDN